MINQSNLIKHLKNLVSFQTTDGNIDEQKKCLEYIKDQFAFYPFIVNEYTSNNYPSLVLTTTKEKHPEIFLLAHIDVVLGSEQLFRFKQVQDKIFGRGVYDMKFAIASYICILEELYKKNKTLPSIGLMFTSEEEIRGDNGPGFLLKGKKYSCNAAFIPDGGENWHIVQEARGMIEVKLTVMGKNAHGSRPWQGKSAITKLFQIGKKIQRLYPSDSEKQEVTVNFGGIAGGGVINQVADQASLWLDIRYLPNQKKEDIIKKIQMINPKSTIEILDSVPVFFTDINNQYVQRWKRIIAPETKNENIFIKELGVTDGPFFSERGIPVIISKPQGGGLHAENEWISISSWVTFSKKLELFLSYFK